MTSLLIRILLGVAPIGCTYWLSHVPEERAAQIASHKALKRAEEEQLTYLSLPSSSAAKKRSKQFFAKKWEEYKRLEAVLNSWIVSRDPDLDFNNTGDRADVVRSDGPKSMTFSVMPTKVAEEQHSTEAAAKRGATYFLQKSPLPAVACPLLPKSAQQNARRQEAEGPVCL